MLLEAIPLLERCDAKGRGPRFRASPPHQLGLSPDNHEQRFPLATLPNVKDEPRPQRARLVLQMDFHSAVSLWKLVREHEA